MTCRQTESGRMSTSTDKLTIQALKQHDKIHPKFKATTGGGSGDQPAVPKTKTSQVRQNILSCCNAF